MLLMWIRKSTKIWWKRLKGFSLVDIQKFRTAYKKKWLTAHMEFEKAAEFRDQIKAIETVMTRQK